MRRAGKSARRRIVNRRRAVVRRKVIWARRGIVAGRLIVGRRRIVARWWIVSGRTFVVAGSSVVGRRGLTHRAYRRGSHNDRQRCELHRSADQVTYCPRHEQRSRGSSGHGRQKCQGSGRSSEGGELAHRHDRSPFLKRLAPQAWVSVQPMVFPCIMKRNGAVALLQRQLDRSGSSRAFRLRLWPQRRRDHRLAGADAGFKR